MKIILLFLFVMFALTAVHYIHHDETPMCAGRKNVCRRVSEYDVQNETCGDSHHRCAGQNP